ncbi:prolipoprotein diacylglyceryl transferase [Clostridium sp. BJN0001]|uniref:prolipoprotein diacylglyceryl transferase n=1 Tax=Clostridium sp. BJN0001 TaxID=2930219 RepID=UPI001FD30369|nr:prolipoprotein diacylglyceryl transferase [Clostridium sp. BJN0001]
MNPIAFSILGYGVRWYGIFIGFSVILGMIIAYYNAKKLNVDFEVISDGFLIVFPSAIIGARLYYVIFEFSYFKDNILSIFNLRTGGLAIHGGILGALISMIIYCKVKNINIVKYLDIIAPSLILAQAIGRWGNFMNGEAHGDVVSYEFIKKFPLFIQKGMYINGSYYNPTFLYESIWNVLIFIILLFLLLYRKKTDGMVISFYIILYSFGRFFIEGLRTDSLMFFNIRMAQLISLIFIAVGIIYLIKIKLNKKY